MQGTEGDQRVAEDEETCVDGRWGGNDPAHRDGNGTELPDVDVLESSFGRVVGVCNDSAPTPVRDGGKIRDDNPRLKETCTCSIQGGSGYRVLQPCNTTRLYLYGRERPFPPHKRGSRTWPSRWDHLLSISDCTWTWTWIWRNRGGSPNRVLQPCNRTRMYLYGYERPFPPYDRGLQGQ